MEGHSKIRLVLILAAPFVQNQISLRCLLTIICIFLQGNTSKYNHMVTISWHLVSINAPKMPFPTMFSSLNPNHTQLFAL
jgi:hypothetical protein